MEMLCPLPYCDAMSRCDETKTIKPTIDEAFVAFSEDIITDYNDSYGLKSLRSHSRNAKQALLYTAQNLCLISQQQIL